MNIEQPQQNGQIATFDQNDSFADQLNTSIVQQLRGLDLTGRTLYIVMPNTVAINRPSGAVVLYNDEDVDKRLAAWPDLRLQSFGNPQFISGGLHKGGFDPNLPISGMTVMVTELNENQEPVFVRSVVLESPEYLSQEKYLVKEEREGKTVFVIKNAIDALGLDTNARVITPGWSYISKKKRAGEDPQGQGITNIKDLARVSRTIIRTLNIELTNQGLNPVIVSQQDGALGEIEGIEIPNFHELAIGTEIDPEETDSEGKKKWYVTLPDGQLQSVFDYFGLGGKESKATASFARRSGMNRVEGVAHIIENNLGPVFLGTDPSIYGVDFERK